MSELRLPTDYVCLALFERQSDKGIRCGFDVKYIEKGKHPRGHLFEENTRGELDNVAKWPRTNDGTSQVENFASRRQNAPSGSYGQYAKTNANVRPWIDLCSLPRSILEGREDH